MNVMGSNLLVMTKRGSPNAMKFFWTLLFCSIRFAQIIKHTGSGKVSPEHRAGQRVE